MAETRRRGAKLEADVTELREQIAAAHQATGSTASSVPVKIPDLSPVDGPKSAGKEMPSRRVSANYSIKSLQLQSQVKVIQKGTALAMNWCVESVREEHFIIIMVLINNNLYTYIGSTL